MDLKQALIDSFTEIMPMFGITPVYDTEEVMERHEAAAQITVLIGLTVGIKGNIVLSLDKSTSLNIVSAMMGGMEVNEFDSMAKSALGELVNMVLGSAIQKLSSSILIDMSPPTLITGKRVSLMISRVKSCKLKFVAGENAYYISFSIE
jgi:chemotaxis protein CheX